MDNLITAGCAYCSEAAGADDSGCRVCGRGLRAIMEADLASYVRTIREREADLRDLYLENSPRRRTAQQQCNIESLKEEIQQLHDVVMGLQTDLAGLYSYTPSSPSHLPNPDSPFNGYDDLDLDDESSDYAYDEWEDSQDPEMDLWPPESLDGIGFEWADERLPARHGVSDDDNLPTLSLFSMCIVERNEEEPVDTITAPHSVSPPVSTSSSSQSVPPSYQGETAIEEVRRKMQQAATSGDSEAIAHVKYLVIQAHRAAAHQRTDAQKVLLSEWRCPILPLPFVVGGEPVCAYVDASGRGIGFFFCEQWQSWRLKACWWEAMGSNIQWAEAVAIELGLRLPARAGYTKRSIVIYSDNIGVVDAILFKHTRQLHVGYVVKRIDYLRKRYQLDLSVKWIPGVDNRADAPSRFYIEKGTQRFPYNIMIPPRLQDFIAHYRPPVSAAKI